MGKLTNNMMRLLREASAAPWRGWDGIVARSPGDATALRALERRGLLRMAGMGEEVDTSRPAEIWEITESGRAVLGAEVVCG